MKPKNINPSIKIKFFNSKLILKIIIFLLIKLPKPKMDNSDNVLKKIKATKFINSTFILSF